MRIAAMLAIMAVLAGCATPNLRDTVLRLDFEKGLCSGTAVGPHTLMTANHCFLTGDLKRVNGHPVRAGKRVKLSADGVLVDVDMTFPKYAKRGPRPVQGQRVRFIGNPGGNADVYREGYVARAWTDGVVIVAPVCKGDSGAGLFADDGRVVGVVSAMTSAASCTFGLSL